MALQLKGVQEKKGYQQNPLAHRIPSPVKVAIRDPRASWGKRLGWEDLISNSSIRAGDEAGFYPKNDGDEKVLPQGCSWVFPTAL